MDQHRFGWLCALDRAIPGSGFLCCLVESSTAVSTRAAGTIVRNRRAARNNYICTIGLMHSAVTVFCFFLSLQEAGEKAVMFFLVLPESSTPVAFESAYHHHDF